jgi:lactate dehydrogenase-like 2-hydroxyacid dehydrogenase
VRLTAPHVVLVIQPHLEGVARSLEPDFHVLRLWTNPALNELERTEAVVLAGEFALDKALLARLPRLAHIACFTTGYDGIDVAWAREQGLIVTHAPAVNHEDVADHALGLILGSWRAIVAGDRRLRAGGWRADQKPMTRSLAGRRLGLVGLGAIGEAVGRRARCLLMEVAWWGPRPRPEAPYPRHASLLELAGWSEVLVVCSRADETNRGLISAEVIQALGPEGLLVNVARGQLVDEEALIAALREGRLGAAALDVYAREPTSVERWADVPNTVLTPHTAGATHESVGRMLALLHANLHAVLGGGAPLTPAA